MFVLALACTTPQEKHPPSDTKDTGARLDTAVTDTADTDTADTDTGVRDTAETADTGTIVVGACGMEASERRWCASCADLLREYPGTPDGPQVLQILGSSNTFDTFCEMDLAGGGWTLAGTNAWGGGWNERNILSDGTFGEPSLTEDYKGMGFVAAPFADLLFENDLEYVAYEDVGDSTTCYQVFQDSVPIDNCGIDTAYVWPMSEGTLADPDLCETALYINVRDWEGGTIPCGDNESARGPAWSTQNKDLGCPLNDPRSSSFILDEWDYNPWGDHDATTTNLPLRMWIR